MGKKSKKNRIGIVYSTNDQFSYNYEEDIEQSTLLPSEQKLYVSLDRKNRKGKEVTLLTGFVGTSEDLQILGKLLKSKCGSGGTSKDGEILVQGNHVQKIMSILKDMGYQNVKKKGGA